MSELLHAPRDWLRKVRRAVRQLLFRPSINRKGVLKLRAAIFLEAIRQAPGGIRIRLFQRSFTSLFAPRPASGAEICHINSLADFESSYRCLAAMLGNTGKTPPQGEMEFLRTIVNRQSVYQGGIGTSDCLFLTALVSVLAPPRVVEIGTLTGFSAALIAATLRRQHKGQGASRVDTVDLSAKCFIDETRQTGFDIAESFSELASMIHLHIPRDSAVVSQLAERNELQIVFIDADHRHPMPLLDLLRVAPYVKGGGWIVLHDIRLGTLGREASEAGQTCRWGAPYGAEWLFGYWPFRKIGDGNIGAIQLPNEKSALIPFALRLMSIPFELEGKSAPCYARRALHRSFEKLV